MTTEELGINSYGAPKPWTEAEESLLGTRADKKLARKLDRPLSAVKRRRIELGISSFNPARHRWIEADDRVLGTRPDDQVAKLIGATVKAIQHRRAQLKIPMCAQQLEQARRGRAAAASHRKTGGPYGAYTADELKLLGTMPDEELARRLGRTVLAIGAQRIQLKIPKFAAKLRKWTPKDDALLGTIPDGELATQLGTSPLAVAHRRRRLRIPVRFAHRRPWMPEEDALLGTASDTEIAARLGRKVEVVCVHRQKLGIPNFYWQQRCGRQRRLFKAGKTTAGRQEE